MRSAAPVNSQSKGIQVTNNPITDLLFIYNKGAVGVVSGDMLVTPSLNTSTYLLRSTQRVACFVVDREEDKRKFLRGRKRLEELRRPATRVNQNDFERTFTHPRRLNCAPGNCWRVFS